MSVWKLLRGQAIRLAETVPCLEPVVSSCVLERWSFADALAHRLAQVLATTAPPGFEPAATFQRVLADHPEIAEAAQADLDKLAATNPACPDAITGLLSFRGFQALQLHRINHALWTEGCEPLAVLLQNWGALAFAMDIHPQARIGRAVFLDHGIGLVIGATAVVEDGANIWHGVTLGSTLTESGDRHPKVRRNVTIGAGATILGNIEIGEGAVVAAGSVVLRAVEPYTLVAGSPARSVGPARTRLQALARTSQ
jgi:serine O-acetyltransferase